MTSDTPIRVAIGGNSLFSKRAAEVLGVAGIEATLPSASVRRWPSIYARIRILRHFVDSDVVLFIHGRNGLGEIPLLLVRVGKPVVMQWVGTDVLVHAGAADHDLKDLAWHWADARWLADELHEAGFAGVDVVPLTTTPLPETIPTFPARFRILAYASAPRPDFYGVPFMAELARRLPDIEFRLAGPDRLMNLPANLRCLGWTDMQEELRNACVLIRPTAHDGLSHAVLEALAWGRHVYWTYAMPGVRQIVSIDETESSLRDLIGQHHRGELPFNVEGRTFVEREFSQQRVSGVARTRIEDIASTRWRRRPTRAAKAAADAALALLEMILFVPSSRRRRMRAGVIVRSRT